MPVYLHIFFFNLLSAFFVFFMMPPLDAWYICCFSLVFPLYNLKKHLDLKYCFFNGFSYGFLFYFAVFFWMPQAISAITGVAGVMGWLLFLGTIGFVGVLYGLLFWCVRKFSVPDKALPLLWVLFEITALPVFPVSCGYLFHDSQFISQAASLVGIYGLALLALYLNLALVQFFTNENKKNLPRVLILFFGVVLFGYYHKMSVWEQTKDKSLAVVVLHTGIDPIEKKTDTEKTYQKVMAQLISALEQYPNARLFLLPESIFVPTMRDGVDFRLLEIKNHLKPNQSVMLGCNTNYLHGVANSAVLVDHEYPDSYQVYRKRHLLLFGEYVPLIQYFPALKKFFLNEKDLNDFIPSLEKTGFLHKELKIATGICFEHAFSLEVAENTQELQPDLLVNISEDGWFASQRASLLHLILIKMRSIETGLSMVRSVNVGVSALILPDGHVSFTNDYQNKPLHGVEARENLYMEVPLGASATLYQKYGYFLPYILLFLFGIFYWESKRKKTTNAV